MVAAESTDPLDNKGALVAWDPLTQKERWRVPHETIWNGGTLSTAGGLVFQGTADGYITAYDAKDGKQLWRFYAGLGIIAAPMSYSAGGKQYVSVLVGYGAAGSTLSMIRNLGWKYRLHPRRLLTFALDARGKLPDAPPATQVVEALDDPAMTLDPAEVATGRIMFNRCMACHGREVVGAGAAPDLRESPIAFDREAFWSVLHDGALIERGMPRYDTLTREQVGQLYAYIRAEARKVAQAPKQTH